MSFVKGALQQVMTGVQYIHSEFKECHNDIKPENVLLDRKPRDVNDVPRFMIADFGCASGFGAAANGDPRYNAPELWMGQSVSYKSDVWALGVMSYELLSGGFLVFTGEKNISGWGAFSSYGGGILVQRLQQGITQPNAQPDWSPFQGYKPEVLRLLQGMLSWDARQRRHLLDCINSSLLRSAADQEMM